MMVTRYLQKNESGIEINQVASPQLRRGGGNGGGGGSSTVYHTLRYVSNGGTPYDDEKYKSGALVQIRQNPKSGRLHLYRLVLRRDPDQKNF